ncbi:MAG TPA: transposase [Polyangia bacterium]|jgi:hypothetical protein|nr:transposase [Polyangia bacterium]
MTQNKEVSERSAMRSVALDVGVRQIALCEVKDGQVIERATVRSVSALEKYLGPNTLKAHVAIEACREAWALHDRLQQWGHQVTMVDTTRVRQLGVGQHGRKTDRIDAQMLALALERGLIPHGVSTPGVMITVAPQPWSIRVTLVTCAIVPGWSGAAPGATEPDSCALRSGSGTTLRANA